MDVIISHLIATDLYIRASLPDSGSHRHVCSCREPKKLGAWLIMFPLHASFFIVLIGKCRTSNELLRTCHAQGFLINCRRQ
ncbi:unnamed protein product [Ixodes persulcatus]